MSHPESKIVFRQNKLAFLFVLFLLGLVLLVKQEFFGYIFFHNEGIGSIIIMILGIALTAYPSVILVFGFLQGRNVDEGNNEYEDLKRQVEGLKDNFSKIESSIENDANLKLSEYLKTISNDSILKAVEDKYADNLFSNFKINFITNELKEVKTRLERETNRINRSSAVNLSLGFATTLFALTFLIYSLVSLKFSSSSFDENGFSKIEPTRIETRAAADTTLKNKIIINQKQQPFIDNSKTLFILFLISFIPRLSVSIFIELFSFFFLRMYKRNLDEIKYLNNERTNIELKLIALESAILNKDDENTLGKILIELSKTERNFILKKGESTVEVEKEKLESNFYKETLESVAKLIKK